MTQVSNSGTKIPVGGTKISVVANETKDKSQTILRLQIRAVLWLSLRLKLDEPPRDKTNKVSVRPAKTQISLGIRPV